MWCSVLTAHHVYGVVLVLVLSFRLGGSVSADSGDKASDRLPAVVLGLLCIAFSAAVFLAYTTWLLAPVRLCSSYSIFPGRLVSYYCIFVLSRACLLVSAARPHICSFRLSPCHVL